MWTTDIDIYQDEDSEEEANFEASLWEVGERRVGIDEGGALPRARPCEGSGAFSRALSSHVLDLRFKGLGRVRLDVITRPLRELRGKYAALRLSDNRLQDDGIAAIVASLPPNGIAHLDVGHNSVGSGSSLALGNWLFTGGCGPLLCLELPDVGLHDRGIEALGKGLGRCKQLRSLNLSGNMLTGGCGEVLAAVVGASPQLRRLEIGWNRLRGPGMALILDEITESASLQVLSLRFNPVGAEPTSVAALARLFERCDSLTHLDAGFTSLGADVAPQLAVALEGNASLLGIHLEGNGIMIDARGYVHACSDGEPSAPREVGAGPRWAEVRRLAPAVADQGESITTVHPLGPARAAHMCWVCECWNEAEIDLPAPSPPLEAGEVLRLHLECDDWQGCALENAGGRLVVVRALPPGLVPFFLSRHHPDEVEEWKTEHRRRNEVRQEWARRAKAAEDEAAQTADAEGLDPDSAKVEASKQVRQEAAQEEASWPPLSDQPPVQYFACVGRPEARIARISPTPSTKELASAFPSLRRALARQGSPSRRSFRRTVRPPPQAAGLGHVNVVLVEPSIAPPLPRARPRAAGESVTARTPRPAWSPSSSIFAMRDEAAPWELQEMRRLNTISAAALRSKTAEQAAALAHRASGPGNGDHVPSADDGPTRHQSSALLRASRLICAEEGDSAARALLCALRAESAARAVRPEGRRAIVVEESAFAVHPLVVHDFVEAAVPDALDSTTRAVLQAVCRRSAGEAGAGEPSARSTGLVEQWQVLGALLAASVVLWERAAKVDSARRETRGVATDDELPAPDSTLASDEPDGHAEEALDHEGGQIDVQKAYEPVPPLDEFAVDFILHRLPTLLHQDGTPSPNPFQFELRGIVLSTEQVDRSLRRRAGAVRGLFLRTASLFRHRPADPLEVSLQGSINAA